MGGVSVLDRCERRVDGVECAYLGVARRWAVLGSNQ
jgi:hypothetical protein